MILSGNVSGLVHHRSHHLVGYIWREDLSHRSYIHRNKHDLPDTFQEISHLQLLAVNLHNPTVELLVEAPVEALPRVCLQPKRGLELSLDSGSVKQKSPVPLYEDPTGLEHEILPFEEDVVHLYCSRLLVGSTNTVLAVLALMVHLTKLPLLSLTRHLDFVGICFGCAFVDYWLFRFLSRNDQF